MGIDFNLEGKLALVTGATRGLGWVIARGFAQFGAQVVINSRSQKDCETKTNELTEEALKAVPCPFDVADLNACSRIVKGLENRHGAIDILVNNAGIIHRQKLAEFSDEDWSRVVNINLNACFVLSREASRGMAKRGWGRIINIGSIMGQVARPTIPAYVASKHGLNGLTKALAVELGPKGITTNTINPGYFSTEFNKPLMADMEFDSMVKNRTPAGRWGEPNELSGAAVFLASNSASYVNGATLTVDGGMTAALN